jgi:hypothetical protein
VAALVEAELGLDRDRIASMADEGGVAAAEVEAQPAVARPSRAGPGASGSAGLLLIAGAGLAALAILLARRVLSGASPEGR